MEWVKTRETGGAGTGAATAEEMTSGRSLAENRCKTLNCVSLFLLH